jgi:hypothetical protein
MTRTLLATAAALFGTAMLFASAAEACVSCEYTPEVVNTPVYGYAHGETHYHKKRVYTAVKRAVRRVRDIADSEPEAKPVETAKTAPVDLDVKSENSTISTASVDKSETVASKDAPTDEPKVSKAIGCKKFFPTVGMTLTVPCE